MKRHAILWLIAIIFLTSIPLEGLVNPAFAVSNPPSETDYPGFKSLDTSVVINKYNFATKTYKAVTVDLKKVVTDAILANRPLKNTKGMYLCPIVLAEYDIVAYNVDGTYKTSRGFGDPSYNSDLNGFKKWEYRYLGYDYNGKSLENDLRHNDTGYADPKKLPYKSWLKSKDNIDTWNMGESNSSVDNMLKTEFVTDDGTGTVNSGKLSVSDVINPSLVKNDGFSFEKAGELTTDLLNKVKQYVQVQAFNSIATKGSVTLRHRTPQKTYYDTFIIDKINVGFVPSMNVRVYLDAECTQEIKSYKFGASEETKGVFVKINTNINMKDIGYSKKEHEFIKSVTNKFMNKESVKKNQITSDTDVTNVSNIFPYVLKRTDKTLRFTAQTTIEPKTDIMNITKLLKGETTLSVTADLPPQIIPDEGDIRADFKIINEDSDLIDVTDKTFLFNGTSINQNIFFKLDDYSISGANTKVVGWRWEVLNRLTSEYEFFSTDKRPVFTLTPSQTVKYLDSNNEIVFSLEATSDKGFKRFANHKTQMKLKDPTDPPPDDEDPKTIKALINAPQGIKAGQEATVSGFAAVTGGEVERVDFGFHESVKSIRGGMGSRDVTFLEYGNTFTSEITAYADFGGSDSAFADTKVTHPLEATFKTNGTFKVNRTVELDSEGSTGTTYYPIDSVTWHIKPLEGQSPDVIKFHTSNVGKKINVDIKAEGLYQIDMIVHSTCTFMGESHRTASKVVTGQLKIYPDLQPVAKLSVPTRVIRDPAHYRMADYIVSDLSYSPDGDEIGKKRFYVRRDTDNDKSLEDETWEMFYEGLNDNIYYESSLVGLYEYRIEVEETNESILSPFWNPANDTRRDDTDSQPLEEKRTEILNVAPITSVIADKRSVDIVIATDYEGVKLSQLKTDSDMLIKDLFELGINLKVHFVNAKAKIGTKKESIYKYVRYGNLAVTQNINIYNTSTYQFDNFIRQLTYKIPWDTRYAKEGEYIPNYGNIPMTYTPVVEEIHSSWYSGVATKFTVQIDAPSDPAKRTHKFDEGLFIQENIPFHIGSNATYSNLYVTLDGAFSKEGVSSSYNVDLYGVDIAQLRAVNFRSGSDKKMLFATDTSSSTLGLDENFKQWTTSNKIEVSSFGISNIKDQLGYGKIVGGKFKDNLVSQYVKTGQSPKYIPSETIFTTELGESYRVGGTSLDSPSQVLYPSKSSESADTSKGLKFQFPPYTAQSVVKYDGSQIAYPMSPISPSFSITLGEGETNDFPVPTERNWMAGFSDLKLTYNQYTYKMVGGNLTKQSYNGATLVSNIVLYNVTGLYTYEKSSYKKYVFQGQNGGVTSYLEVTANMGYQVKNTEAGLYYLSHGWYEYSWYYGTVYVQRHAIQENRFSSMPKKVAQYEDADSMITMTNRDGTLFVEKVFFGTSDVTELEFIKRNYYGQIDPIPGPAYGKRKITSSYVSFMGLSRPEETYTVGQGQSTAVYTLEEGRAKIGFYNLYNFKSDYWNYNNNSVMAWLSGDTIRSAVMYITDSYYPQTRLVITDSGKAYGYGLGYAGAFGIYTQKKYNYSEDIYTYGDDNYPSNSPNSGKLILSDARSLSTPNGSPLTMHELLSTSAKGQNYSNFANFKINLIAEYSVLQYKAKVTKLLNDTVTTDLLYADYENDPLSESAIEMTHDPSVLENPLGTDPNHGKTVQSLTGYPLTKTGLYSLKPKVKDNPNEDDRFADYRLWNKDNMTYDILVHRKPFAVPTLTTTATGNPSLLNLRAKDNGSVDVDHQSKANRGIVQVEWAFKPKISENWTYTRGSLGTTANHTINYGEKYYVSYRVQDEEGEWSDPLTQEITAIPQLYFDASLKPKNSSHDLNKFLTGNTLTFHNIWTSYQLAHSVSIQMYDGSTPVLSPVTLNKSAQTVDREDPPEVYWKDVDFFVPKNAGLKDKQYRFRVTAYDQADPSKHKFKDFYVNLVNNTAPTIKVIKMTPETLLESDDLLLTVLPEDLDNDRLTVTVSGLFFKTTNGNNTQKEELKPFSKFNLASGKMLDLNDFKALKAGNYELKFLVEDPQGAKGMASLAFTVGEFSIADIQVTGSWNHWRGQKDLFGEQLENHKGRYLSYESVRIDVKALGDPEKVEVRMSPELESMAFTSANGKKYFYKEALGYDVQFPLALKLKKEWHTVDYILPLAPSTLSPKGQRLRQSYWVDVTIYKMGRSKTKRYGGNSTREGIEITGNVYDHVYQQPKKKSQ